MDWVLTFLASLIIAEAYGYWLHVLLHSYIFPSLSKAHMNHHILSYPPGGRMRKPEYIQDRLPEDRALFGIGLEWIIPSIALIAITFSIELLLGLSLAQICLSIFTMVIYSVFLFLFMHESLHIKDHYLLSIKPIKKWYLKARKLHDIHHHYVDKNGLMNRNYGIAFFFFDKLFGTYMNSLRGKFDKAGIIKAEEILSKHKGSKYDRK